MTVDPLLQRIARKRVGAFSHQAYGMWVWEHAHREGFPGPNLNTTCTDDIASGYESPEDAVGDDASGWGKTHGVGHNLQMLGQAKINGAWQECNFNVCGVARQGNKYEAIFGKR